MMVSNVGGFVCHIANIIIFVYIIIFYRESMATPISVVLRVFYLLANVTGLLISATAGIVVNHAVRIYTSQLLVTNLFSYTFMLIMSLIK